MKYLNINFSDRELRYQSRRNGEAMLPVCLLSAIGFVCIIWLLITIYAQSQQHSDLDNMEISLRKDLTAKQPIIEKNTSKLEPAKIEALNFAISALNVPWRDLFDAIEETTPAEIALISLEPDAEKRSLRLVAEAADPQSMLNYLGTLKRQGLFVSVSLIKHEINTEDPNSPYRFQFEARWKELAQ